jgi:hypothetical protein
LGRSLLLKYHENSSTPGYMLFKWRVPPSSGLEKDPSSCIQWPSYLSSSHCEAKVVVSPRCENDLPISLSTVGIEAQFSACDLLLSLSWIFS